MMQPYRPTPLSASGIRQFQQRLPDVPQRPVSLFVAALNQPQPAVNRWRQRTRHHAFGVGRLMTASNGRMETPRPAATMHLIASIMSNSIAGRGGVPYRVKRMYARQDRRDIGTLTLKPWSVKRAPWIRQGLA